MENKNGSLYAAIAAYIEGYNKAIEDFTNKYKYLIN